jgi:CheY-like chemotaxis protein
VELIVKDNGQGISADFLPHVFERFRQADSGTTRKFGGLGLGLAIVRHLVELHGGSVKADSEGEGKGATFTVMLPMSGGVQVSDFGSPELLPEDTVAKRVLPGMKILLIDDEADTRDLLVRMLSTYGAEARAAGSAAEALILLSEWRPDILVSDISKPEVDGYSFIRQVRAGTCNPTIPAIALTAHARAEDGRLALEAGFQEHFSKPLSLADLALSIASWAGRTVVESQTVMSDEHLKQ